MAGLLSLIERARGAGLVLWQDGRHLAVRGPESAEPIVRELMDRKAEILHGLRTGALPREQLAFRFVADVMEFGDIPEGWTPRDWRARLRCLAGRCASYRPDLADYYRRWADDIDARLPEHRAPAAGTPAADAATVGKA